MELNKENYDKNGAKHYPLNSYPGNRTIESERCRKFGEPIPGDPMFGSGPEQPDRVMAGVVLPAA